MRRATVALAVCAIAWASGAVAADAQAQPEPGADQIQFAAHEHDLGYRAYVERRYDEAAIHFENAFFAAPNPAELRSAIRARREGGDLARAATLAAISQRRFGSDAASAQLASDVIAQARPKVYEVFLVSPEVISVAVDEKVVTNEKLTEVRFFVSPGRHELLVSWTDADRSERVPLEATAGGSQTLRFAPAPAQPPAPQTPTATPAPGPPPTVPVQQGPFAQQGPPLQATSAVAERPFPPAVFVTAAALTVVGAGITLWSGIDAMNNPGQDAVRRACVGQGESCPQYQAGLFAQRRTNVLIGVTGGGALVTAALGLFFTRWSSPPRASSGAVRLEPAFAVDRVSLIGRF